MRGHARKKKKGADFDEMVESSVVLVVYCDQGSGYPTPKIRAGTDPKKYAHPQSLCTYYILNLYKFHVKYKNT